MPTQRKIETVETLTDKLNRSQMILVADYRGLTVAEISDLRKKLRDTGAELMVTKNTLALRAAKETGNEALEQLLAGPTALTFAFDDVAKTAKVISDYNKGPKKLAIRGGLLGNTRLDEGAVDRVSTLPTRQQVQADIVGGISAPLFGVVGVINAAVSNVLYVLQARIDQLQPEGEAAA